MVVPETKGPMLFYDQPRLICQGMWPLRMRVRAGPAAKARRFEVEEQSNNHCAGAGP